MTTLSIILLSLGLHIAAALIAWAYLRKQRQQHHRGPLPVIGTSRALTTALHLRLCQQAPQSDWTYPTNMGAKLGAWRAQAQAAEQQARNA